MKTGVLLLIGIYCGFACKSTIKHRSVASDKDLLIVKPAFNKYFDSCGVQGAIVIFDNAKKQWIVSDSNAVKVETLPASTFKIINLLIALETKTIADEHTIVPWVGTTDTVKYGYRPDIYRDMTVREAFELSAGWVFVELAKKIGKEQYKKYLSACDYGNLDLSEQDADFWNFGGFAISPLNQVQFLEKLYNGNLPFSPKNMETVKRVMITEHTQGLTIHSKTGWTRDKNINTGWWVGYVENANGQYFFATRLLQDRKQNRADFGACRKEITKAILRELSILK